MYIEDEIKDCLIFDLKKIKDIKLRDKIENILNACKKLVTELEYVKNEKSFLEDDLEELKRELENISKNDN